MKAEDYQKEVDAYQRTWDALHIARETLKATESSSDWETANQVERVIDVLIEILGEGHRCDICYEKFEDEADIENHVIFLDELTEKQKKDLDLYEPDWLYRTCKNRKKVMKAIKPITKHFSCNNRKKVWKELK